MLSIIIVNYNLTEKISHCLNSIIVHIKTSVEIIVVDNNSTDRNVELLQSNFPQVKFYFLKENLGFAKANNFGVQKSSGEYILFLNPDTLLIEDFISPILRFVKENQNAGACAPMLLNEDRTYQGSTGIELGYIYEFCEAFMLIKYLRLIYNFILLRKKNDIIKVNWLSAACLLISRKIFLEVGGFNPNYFLNYEDIDLCRRIINSGYSNYYFTGLKCVHSEHASQKNNLGLFVRSRYESRIIFANDHYPPLKKNIIRYFHITGLFLRIVLIGLFYSGLEKSARLDGYKQSLKLFLND